MSVGSLGVVFHRAAPNPTPGTSELQPREAPSGPVRAGLLGAASVSQNGQATAYGGAADAHTDGDGALGQTLGA